MATSQIAVAFADMRRAQSALEILFAEGLTAEVTDVASLGLQKSPKSGCSNISVTAKNTGEAEITCQLTILRKIYSIILPRFKDTDYPRGVVVLPNCASGLGVQRLHIGLSTNRQPMNQKAAEQNPELAAIS